MKVQIKMKIIICGNSFWSLHNFRKELIKKLSKNNKLYLMSDGNKIFFDKYERSKLLSVKFENKDNNFIFFKELRNLFSILNHYNKIKPDLVLNFNIKPVIYNTIISFLFPKTKIVNTITGSGRVFQKKKIFYKLISKFYILLIKKSDLIFFQNQFDRDLFVGSNTKLKKKSILVNGSGVNLIRYNNKNFDKKNQNFLFASRLMHIKGITEYLKAAETIKKVYGRKVNFYVAGEIKNNDSDYISSKELNYFIKKKIIIYLGFQSDIRKIFLKANCIVLPSKLNEGIPRILIEAAASSKFMISSNRPGCSTIIKNQYNGYLIKNINKKKLANNMLRYLTLNNNKKNFFFKNSKLMSQKFDEADIVTTYLKQLNKLHTVNL